MAHPCGRPEIQYPRSRRVQKRVPEPQGSGGREFMNESGGANRQGFRQDISSEFLLRKRSRGEGTTERAATDLGPQVSRDPRLCAGDELSGG